MKQNEIIARFLGWKEFTDPTERWFGCFRNDEGVILKNTPTEPLLFHSDWNWLVPVIEKIEKIGYCFEKNYQPIEDDWQCLITKDDNILFQEFGDDSLITSYRVVVRFVEWYTKGLSAENNPT